MIPFNWYFCSVIQILVLIYVVYVNMDARYYRSLKKGCWLNILSYSYEFFFYFRIFLLLLSFYHVFPQLPLSKLLAFNTSCILSRQYQIRGIGVTKDWYFRQCFSIILNSTPMIFHSLWIKCGFTIFDLQLNFLVRFDERKIFESCFLMQNPWHVT